MSPADDPDLSWTEAFGLREPSGRHRREAERLLAFWQGKQEEYGGDATIGSLDLSRVDSREWWNRFLIAVDPVIERSSLVLYGPRFAELLNLPPLPRTDLPMMRQIPVRYSDIFLRACTQMHKEMQPVRIEGEVERSDGRIEQYRAVFIPVGVKPNSLTCFAFGSFNCRILGPE